MFALHDLVLASLYGSFFLLSISSPDLSATRLVSDLGDPAVPYMPAIRYITVYIPEQWCPSDSQTRLVTY
jgi:hypothetical protein